jgi:hypothetical protein
MILPLWLQPHAKRIGELPAKRVTTDGETLRMYPDWSQHGAWQALAAFAISIGAKWRLDKGAAELVISKT